MASSRWKEVEREIARLLGGERTGPRGEMLPDVDLPDLAPEVKYQGRLSLKKEDLDQAARNAGLQGKPWALFLVERVQRGASRCRRVLVMDPETFAAFYHDARRWREREDSS